MIWRALEAASREPAGRSPGRLASDIVGASSCALSSGRTTPSWLRRQKSAASVSRPSVAARPSVAVDSARRAHPARAKGGSLVAMVAKGAILAIAAPKPNTSGLTPLRRRRVRSRRLHASKRALLAGTRDGHGTHLNAAAWSGPGWHRQGWHDSSEAWEVRIRAASSTAARRLPVPSRRGRSTTVTILSEVRTTRCPRSSTRARRGTASQAAHSAPTACRNGKGQAHFVCGWHAHTTLSPLGAPVHSAPHRLYQTSPQP